MVAVTGAEFEVELGAMDSKSRTERRSYEDALPVLRSK